MAPRAREALRSSLGTERRADSVSYTHLDVYKRQVTDSLRAKHCPPGGSYQLGGHDIEISESGLAYLKGTDTTAGSTPVSYTHLPYLVALLIVGG